MTAKQKANRERFKKVVAEAKKLRSKNKKLTQAQAVKQAWAIFKGKKVGAVKSKPTIKRKILKKYHKDVKSHNVNVRVISGVYQKGNLLYKIRDDIEKQIKLEIDIVENLKNELTWTKDRLEKSLIKTQIQSYKKSIILLKKQLRDQNKIINNLLK